jgi:Asp-tRNA(Asn)/Glu-tRNA(Gln) amidotransferase A subunit family amidase
VLTPEEIKITESTVEDLATLLAKGEFSAVTVTKAFLRRAALAQKAVRTPIISTFHLILPEIAKINFLKCNCITELLPERALAHATYLDSYLKEHGKPIGPLHGVPLSVKEHLGLKDLDHNAGFVAWVGRTSSVDSHIVEILERAGCVAFVRTTQPQSLMHLETSSNLYGYVLALGVEGVRVAI